MTKAKPIFRKVDAHKYSKLGVRRKKKVRYRFPRGRDNKIRLNLAGRLRKVKVGFKNENVNRGLVKDKKVIMIYNTQDLKKIKEEMVGIIGKIGDKKKKEIAEQVVKNKVEIYGFNAKKFLDEFDKKFKERKEKKDKRAKAKLARDKKAKDKAEKEEKEKIKKEAEEKKKKESEKLEGKIENKKEEKELSADEKKVKEAKMKEKKK